MPSIRSKTTFKAKVPSKRGLAEEVVQPEEGPRNAKRAVNEINEANKRPLKK